MFVLCGLVTLCDANHYTNHWAVHIDGDEETAKRLAERHGFIYDGKVCLSYFVIFSVQHLIE